MALESSAKLGPYEILRELGRGGMGVVYLGRDTRLERDVAIKALPEHLAQDPDRLARFEREAKTLAQLNHPNVAGIHGVEEHEGARHLVLEYVEGETLAARLDRGPLPVDEALEVAVQIAAGVEAAHDAGVIHRDLKPGNVMLKPDGTVKVLDFGLAKAMAAEARTAGLPDCPTLTAETRPGTVLGTAAYMSPEQARGRAVDQRTDIWSFGIIFFECLTGASPFKGETANDSVGAILHKEPDWSRLPPSTPREVLRLLRRCLTKEPRRRLQAIGDARVELEEAASADVPMDTGPSRGRLARMFLLALPWLLSAGLLAWVMTPRSGDRATSDAPADNRVKKWALALPDATRINFRDAPDTWSKIGFSRLLAISPDGERTVVTLQEGETEKTGLYVKDANDFAWRRVTGGKNARGAFLSPDGLWVGFLVENELQKVRLPGGAPQPICEVNSAAFDATWRADGTIVYSTDLGLWQVSADGGQAKQITSIDLDSGVRGHHFPHTIAGTQSIIFTLTTETGQHAAVLSLDDGTWRELKKHAADTRYVASGHLVFARGSELFASVYDPSDPTNVGTEVPIARGVHTIPGQGGAVVSLFATSNTGTLTLAPQVDPPEPDALVWVDHEGNEEELVRGSGHWMHQRLSPNGDRILFNRLTNDGMLDLYIYDIERDQTHPLTHTGNAYDAEWSPDGRTVGFAALDEGGRSIYLVPVDFSDRARKIIDGSNARPHFSQWSDDGSTLVFFDRSKGGIWTTSPDGDGKLDKLIQTSLGEGWAMISSDGELITYVGWEPERHVYVQRYPDLGPRIRVSRAGGGEPRWAPDSRTLYFREAGRIYKATITKEPVLDVTNVTTLPIEDIYDAAFSAHQHYDLSLDGMRFLMVRHGRRYHPTSVHVIENWATDLGSR